MMAGLTSTLLDQIIGVVLVKKEPSMDLVSMFEITSKSPSARWLAEKETTVDSIAIVMVLLLSQTLAWITGIILLIATLLGNYFLMNMPLTRDALLYYNVKLVWRWIYILSSALNSIIYRSPALFIGSEVNSVHLLSLCLLPSSISMRGYILFMYINVVSSSVNNA